MSRSGGGPNIVAGSFYNDGQATIDGSLTVLGGLFNTGVLTLTANGSLSGEEYLVNSGVLDDAGNLSAPQTTFNEGGQIDVEDGSTLTFGGGAVYGGVVEADATSGVALEYVAVLDGVTLSGGGTFEGIVPWDNSHRRALWKGDGRTRDHIHDHVVWRDVAVWRHRQPGHVGDVGEASPSMGR